MAFDPIQEDCLRLILEGMRRDRVYPLEDARYIERGYETYRTDPAPLIVTDRDRSFHLVAKAAELADYRASFAPDEAEAERSEQAAYDYLREAVELDPGNWDARRMLAELESESTDAFASFLAEHRDEVRVDAERAAADVHDAYAREFGRDLARRPYERWLAALASRQLICGRYRMALATAEDALAYDPDDLAGARHTAVLAMAKLEAPLADLLAFRRAHAAAYRPEAPVSPRRHRRPPSEQAGDPWTLLATLAIQYRALDLDGAERTLRSLVRSQPHAAHALYYQAEFPEGLFSRVNVEPGTEDELAIALSEATPLLQEGMGSPDAAGLSLWIADHELVQGALDAADGPWARAPRGADAGGDRR